MFTELQKRALLEAGRRAITNQVLGLAEPVSVDVDVPLASGVFVTIKRGGELRGCLGTLQCSRGLVAEITRCAADAAAEDPRFPPVAADELPGIRVEISVLGPLEEIDPRVENAFAIGRHGLVVEQGHRRGLLLPQVATERQWSAEQFLRQTCLKAGLSADAWKRGARISRFDADVFGD
jgi:AmmeMemoRadiSam system protein A